MTQVQPAGAGVGGLSAALAAAVPVPAAAVPQAGPYQARPLQAALAAARKRFTVVVAHRRFGKTVFAINELLRGTVRCDQPAPRLAYVAPYYRQAKAVAWDYLRHYGGAAGATDGRQRSRFMAVDLTRGWGPMKVIRWTSSATPHGISGAATKGTAAKGKYVLDAAAGHLADFIGEFRALQKGQRVDHRVKKPTLPTYPTPD